MNASLAKEEKDFTATVVVSDGKTIYVPTWDEKKKRLKKVPKRLSDCVQFENDFVHRDLSESLMIKQEKRMREKMEEVAIVVDDSAMMTNKNDIVKNMVHVNVNVERLSVLDNLQVIFESLYLLSDSNFSIASYLFTAVVYGSLLVQVLL